MRPMGRLWLALLIISGTALAVANGIAFYFAIVAHRESGVPMNHYPVVVDGSYYYRPTGGPAESRPKYAMTEEQYRTYERFNKPSHTAARVAAVFFAPTFILYFPYVLRLARTSSTRKS